ncbi:MAG: YcaO-like family protein [Bdellovibrionia bacterium]
MNHPLLIQMINSYPIPGCSEPKEFREVVEIDSLKLELVGLTYTHNSNVEITASAAGFDPTIYTRAYFELIERTSLFKAEQERSSFFLENGGRTEKVEISREEVFPESNESTHWRYAKSNGVAAHLNWNKACHAAALELKERHALLTSWYGNLPPQLLGTPSEFAGSPLTNIYDIRHYWFKGSRPVVGVFGFPKKKDHPLFFGFGAHETLEGATQHAVQETYQRLGFTWGEEVLSEVPEAAPTPLYHLNYYLCPEKVGLIQRWLVGNLPDRKISRLKSQPTREIRFVDLTPEGLVGKCAVVKAICDDYMPLSFGNWHPWIGPELGLDLFPHPIS